tara:strand:- start:288 stop:1409 length:1122 start_codon:yes stop_codon:yes gene_type:complete
MACPADGQISVQSLVDEFGGSPPHALTEYYRNAGLVPGNNTNVPESGQFALTNCYSAVNEIQHTHSDGDTHANYATIFGSNYASTIPKRVIVPAGVTVGGTTTHAMLLPSGMGGTIIFDISGNVHGYGGAANGGNGGDAIHCVQTSGVTVTVNSGGVIYGGGGGGGQGGAGGDGGNGGQGGTGGGGRVGGVTFSGGAGGAGGAGGSGGTGGAGGMGQGYNQSATSGSAGSSGSGGSGGSQGVHPTPQSAYNMPSSQPDHPAWGGDGGDGGTGGNGGNGGTGGTGGSFGNSGATGATGADGGNGGQGTTGGNGSCFNHNSCNYWISIGVYNGHSAPSAPSGDSGSAGSSGGLAGHYIYNRASITLNNSGTVGGR